MDTDNDQAVHARRARQSRNAIRLVGFDGDDTLWRSQDYFDAAQLEFERIVGAYVDLVDCHERLYAVENGNLALFGYGVKGMVLSMIEAAVEITEARIEARDLQRIVALGKELLQHPVELLPGIREAVATIAQDFDIVLITKGDLFHQEAKVRQSGLAGLFRRIEIVSEKDAATYRRLLAEFQLAPMQFAMIGNSLRSDIAPVLQLGGWGVHMPYHTTWVHDADSSIAPGDAGRWCSVLDAQALPGAVRALASRAGDASDPAG
jgi:putative hydrolase of the HAD superfamily